MLDPWLDLAEKNAAVFVARNGIADDRDDFFQIARLAGWQAWQQWRPGGMDVRAWLATKVWMAMLDALSSKAYGGEIGRGAFRRGERRISLRLPDDLVAPDRTDRHLERMAAKQLVERGLRALSPREATIVSLHDLDGYRQEDIGEVMGICSSRVSQIRTVALAKMHDRLAA